MFGGRPRPFRQLIDAVRLASGQLRYPLCGSERYAPFFIVGSGRCGSTLLRRILEANSHVHIPPEIPILSRQIELFRRVQHLDWAEVVHLVFAPFEFSVMSVDHGVAIRPLVMELVDAQSSERNLACLLDRYYRYHGETRGKSVRRWGDKTPINVFALDEVRSVFPDARFIHVLRDGVDVVASMIDQGRTLEYAANRWVTSVRSATRFARSYAKQCLLIRYEELVTEPSAVVERVCDFTGIPFVRSMLSQSEHVPNMGDVPLHHHHRRVSQPISAASVGRGRANLTSSQKRQLRPMLEPTLFEFGYERMTET
ncbi:MAG: sulfotransferase [Planctomycetota bacterium]|nr:MAG: sulfotransferase [Planctomycetota bacterium]REK46565.1 MAG: sulfotransferase [Planctomycetota bacterium]